MSASANIRREQEENHISRFWTFSALVLTGISVSGCFDFTAKSTVDAKGKVSGDAEIAVSAQLAGLAAGLGKDPSASDPLKNCGEDPSADKLPNGIRLTRGVRGARGDMLTCTVHFEIDDPIAVAARWKSKDLPDDGPMQVPTFSFTRLSDSAYRLAATVQPKGTANDDMKDNPFAAMFVAALANHYLSLSISALRVENTTGEVDDGGKRVTWKIPVTMMLNPPAGYKQEMRADIVYADDSWLSKIKRFVGLEPAPVSATPSVAPVSPAQPSTPKVDVAEQKRQLAERIAATESQLSAAKVELEQARVDVESATKRLTDQRAILSKIEFKAPRFSMEPQRFGRPEPIIAFTLANNSAIAIKKIYVEGTLQTPGRSVPWIKESFNYEISGGVEPNESRAFSLAPNQFGPWGKIEQDQITGAVLSLRLISFEDSAGKSIGADVTASNAASKSVERVTALQTKVDELETRLLGLKSK